MAQELGKIEKPAAEPFREERRVYLVPLMMAPQEPPAELRAILERFWEGADEGVQRLEWRLGEVKYVLMEMVDRGGEGGLKVAEQLSPGAGTVAGRRVERGAAFQHPAFHLVHGHWAIGFSVSADDRDHGA